MAAPFACSKRTCRVSPTSSERSSTSSHQASSSTGGVVRSSHAIRAIPIATATSTARTPPNQTGSTSAAQFSVTLERTAGALVVPGVTA